MVPQVHLLYRDSGQVDGDGFDLHSTNIATSNNNYYIRPHKSTIMETAESTIEMPASANAAQNNAETFAKHKKSSRFFPAIEDIKKGDRFNILKGTGIHSATLNATISLNEDIRVEILGENAGDSTGYKNFKALKLTQMGDGSWANDPKFGTLTVEYTDLSAWGYRPKK